MNNPFPQAIRSIRFWLLLAFLSCIFPQNSSADPVIVRTSQGTVHGYLEMRSQDGHVVATGDSVQVAHGDRVTTHTVFNYKDGSVDDETTVFSQHHSFQLITYHHIQKGPAFPHPVDLAIDARSGQVTVRSTGKDGKQVVKTDHVGMPPDLGNGMVPLILANVRSDAAQTTIPILVTTPKPRLVKLLITRSGEDTFSIGDSSHKAVHYEIRIEIGGIAGVIAPLVGKAPPNLQIWLVGGEAPTFLREQGSLCEDCPVMTIQLASPVWPGSGKPGS